MTFRVALAQVSSGYDVNENLAAVDEYAARAAESGARLVVFPEAMMRKFGGGLKRHAQPVDGPWADGVRAIAQREDITIVAGMFTPGDESRVRNTLLVTGAVEAHYDKIHLYDAFGYAESETVTPGDDPLVITIDDTTIGITTCYDIRFSGLFTTLARRGATITTVSASWGRGPGKADQWELLARARALDATTYLLACDQPDTGDGVDGPLGVGHSIVVRPDGTVDAKLGAEAGLLIADIDPELIAATRRNLPVLHNARF